MLIALKSMANGKFVCAENKGADPLIANRDAVGDWESFDLVDLGNNRVSLKAVINNKYVCAENKGALPLIANRGSVGEWETFEKVNMGGNKFALKSMANGKFVCAENKGTKSLIANRAAAAEWETFESPLVPKLHGFKFANSGFANDVVPELEVRTNALCGGMAYTALDYYSSNMPIPNQPFPPASQTTLRRYLYGRQVASIENNLDKWAEVKVNPLGARDTEFFNWGISARIQELKQFLDKGIPCVLCLTVGDLGHQVVAYDYTMGRYKGDLGDYVEDFKIFVYDPNYPEQTMTISADKNNKVFKRNDGNDPGNWRTYFVDSRYHMNTPSPIPSPNYPNDGLIYELVLEFYTGGVYLHGGNKNVDLAVKLTDGTQQTYLNINLGARWVVGSHEFAQVVLKKPVREDQLRELIITSGDNWEMLSVDVYKRGSFFLKIKRGGSKLFTGTDNKLTVPINSVSALGLDLLVHVQGIGDKTFDADQSAGSQGRQIEGFQINFNPAVTGLGMHYMAHVQGIGDTAWVTNGQFVGTRGQGRRIEGFAIKLTGSQAASYTVEYMANVQNTGDTQFFKDGGFCGTRGKGLAIQSMRVRVLKK
jgi:hypothetical protein